MSVLFARETPVRGKLALAGGHLIANLDRRPAFNLHGHSDDGGVGAFDPLSGEPLWSVWGAPPLAAADPTRIYAYARTGLVLALDHTGHELWRTSVNDDRSAPAQVRGDREAPFIADVLIQSGQIIVAAGAEVLRLAADDGSILGRAVACVGDNAVVARLAGAADRVIIATCAMRTAWDDERSTLEPALWQVTPTLESLRLTPGGVVAFEPDLQKRWRRPPDDDGILIGDRAPAVSDGLVVLAAAHTAKDGSQVYLSLSHDELIAMDKRSGQVVWRRHMPGGRGYVDPVVVDGGVLAGFEPVLYSLADGSIRWHLQLDRPRLDTRAAPLVDDARLLFAADNAIVGVDIAGGDARVVAHLAELPGEARFTTHLVRGPFGVYFGLADPERAPMLWGMFLEN